MAFKWHRIRSYADSETALYRLLGEMMQRQATSDDLEQTHEFLQTQGPGADCWRSIGEALYRTTNGAPAGFDIWVAWARTLENFEFDGARHDREWLSFHEELSEAVEPEVVPDALHPSTSADDEDDDAQTDVMEAGTGWSRPVHTGVLGGSATQLLRLVPTGPYAIRLFGQEYPDVDEYSVLTLMKRGLFLGCQIRYGANWIWAGDHPAFQRISMRLRDEATRILGDSPAGEVTVPQ